MAIQKSLLTEIVTNKIRKTSFKHIASRWCAESFDQRFHNGTELIKKPSSKFLKSLITKKITNDIRVIGIKIRLALRSMKREKPCRTSDAMLDDT